MPLVKVNMIKGKPSEYKKSVLDCIHVGLMESIGIEDWDRFQRIVEFPKEDFETAPEKTDNFMIIELTLFPGRTKEQKEDAISAITSRLANSLGITPTDVFIVINEPTLENWGMGGVQKGVSSWSWKKFYLSVKKKLYLKDFFFSVIEKREKNLYSIQICNKDKKVKQLLARF